MIGYVFWHVRADEVDEPEYEEGLATFHRSLAEHPPAGFVSSVACRFAVLPWLEGGTVYEDWYLVDDYAALGELNARAASGRHAASHNRVASFSVRGTGGLYRLEEGQAGHESKLSVWIGKPAGMRTPDFLAELRSAARKSGCTLWRRELTLGPAPEYCLHSDKELDLRFPNLTVPVRKHVWTPQRGTLVE